MATTSTFRPLIRRNRHEVRRDRRAKELKSQVNSLLIIITISIFLSSLFVWLTSVFFPPLAQYLLKLIKHIIDKLLDINQPRPDRVLLPLQDNSTFTMETLESLLQKYPALFVSSSDHDKAVALLLKANPSLCLAKAESLLKYRDPLYLDLETSTAFSHNDLLGPDVMTSFGEGWNAGKAGKHEGRDKLAGSCLKSVPLRDAVKKKDKILSDRFVKTAASIKNVYISDSLALSANKIKKSKIDLNALVPKLPRKQNATHFISLQSGGNFTISLGFQNSGLSFHQHSESWNYLLMGEKLWFLYGGNQKFPTRKGFDAHKSSFDWFNNTYSTLTEKEMPLEVHQKAGMVLYLPEGYLHASLTLSDLSLSLSQQSPFEEPASQFHYHKQAIDRANRGDLEGAFKALQMATKAITVGSFDSQGEGVVGGETYALCHDMGRILEAQQKIPQAIEMYKRAISLNIQFSPSFERILPLLLNSKDPKQILSAASLVTKAERVGIVEGNPLLESLRTRVEIMRRADQTEL